MTDRPSLRVGVLHPDLGLGGAERLVVDAARQLQASGHRVTIFTARHDRARSFEDTRDGTLDVRVRGAFLPPNVGQRLRAPCTIARMAYLAAAVRRSGERFDVVLCDLVAHALPLLDGPGRPRILFYCHFPDRLLAPPGGYFYRLYRAPIDRLEAVGTGLADRVLVNSRFTQTVFRRAFPRLGHVPVEVLHPGVDASGYDPSPPKPGGEVLLLSVSRFEPSKNLGLAIEALADLRRRLPPRVFAPVRLVLAGGHDAGRREPRDTLAALQALAHRHDLGERVAFVRSPSEAERRALLARCRCVVYTPVEEHFGFGPLEAMAAARPVVAVARGGPLETVEHGRTGFLCQPTAPAFAEALAALIADIALAERMGRAGRLHVSRHFSLAAFGARLDAFVRGLAAPGDR